MVCSFQSSDGYISFLYSAPNYAGALESLKADMGMRYLTVRPKDDGTKNVELTRSGQYIETLIYSELPSGSDQKFIKGVE